MDWYIKELVGLLEDSLSSDGKIMFDLDTDSIILDVAQAVPLGLILNEGITNAIKYAFPGPEKGRIVISHKQGSENNLALRIADNGVGLPATFDPRKSTSIGMKMIRGLTEQLEGEFNVLSENGLLLEITFKQQARRSDLASGAS